MDQCLDVCGTRKGTLQLVNADGTLEIRVQRGLPDQFLEHFRKVARNDDCACARALRDSVPVVIEDTERDEHGPNRSVVRTARIRSVVSVPMLAPHGKCIGVASAYFEQPHRPDAWEWSTLMRHAAEAAAMIVWAMDDDSPRLGQRDESP